MNGTTEWSKVPKFELAEVMNDIVKRILGLRWEPKVVRGSGERDVGRAAEK